MKDILVQQAPVFGFNLLISLLIILGGWIVVFISRKILGVVLSRSERVNELLKNFAIDIFGKTIWALVIVMALSQIGIDVAPLIAGLGLAGFVLGFAFKDALGNLASGVMVLLNDPFCVGDFVEMAGQSGKVVDLNLMATTLTSSDNKKITIPNSKVWGSPIVNHTAENRRRVDLNFGIGYEDDMEQARNIIERILEEDERILDEPESTVQVKELADSSINFIVRPWVQTSDYWDVYYDVTRKVKEDFDKEEISIPFPQMDVHYHKVE